MGSDILHCGRKHRQQTHNCRLGVCGTASAFGTPVQAKEPAPATGTNSATLASTALETGQGLWLTGQWLLVPEAPYC